MMMKDKPLPSLQFWSWVRKKYFFNVAYIKNVFCSHLTSILYHTISLFIFCLFICFCFLVPPSPPICKIEGRPEYGQNISLTCKSEEGSPEPTTKWKTVSVENIPRPYPPKAFQCMYLTTHFSCANRHLWQTSYFKLEALI